MFTMEKCFYWEQQMWKPGLHSCTIFRAAADVKIEIKRAFSGFVFQFGAFSSTLSLSRKSNNGKRKSPKLFLKEMTTEEWVFIV